MRPWQETEYIVLEVILMNSAQFIAMLAVAVAVCAAFIDVKARRIPNRLTYPAILIGLGLQGGLHGLKRLLRRGSGGRLVCGVLMLVPFVWAMGGGGVEAAPAARFLG